jgi:oligosaccharyltransferase complex subunit alpha (ribophorin I)
MCCTRNLTKPLSSRLVLADDFSPPPVFVNSNLVHIINLERNYAKETVNVVIENVSEEPQSDYYVPFPSWQMAKIGGFEVKDRKNPQGGLFKVSPAEYGDQRYAACCYVC